MPAGNTTLNLIAVLVMTSELTARNNGGETRQESDSEIGN
jgi:hypothetical protein